MSQSHSASIVLTLAVLVTLDSQVFTGHPRMRLTAGFHMIANDLRRSRIADDRKETWGPFLESPETFRVTKVSLYLQQEHVSCFETLQLFFLYFYLKHIKRAGFHSKRIIVLRITFRAR